MKRLLITACLLTPLFGFAQAPSLARAKNPSAFMARARAFLQRNPTAPEAPAVLAEIYMLSVAAKDEQSAHHAMRGLVFRYPKSVQARFVVQNHGEAKKYEDFLKTILKDSETELLGRLDGLANAVILGFHVFRDSFRPDTETALVGALAARRTDDKELEQLLNQNLLEQIKTKKADGEDLPPALQKAVVILDAHLQAHPALARIKKLHAVDDSKAARVYEEYYLMQLPVAERQKPAVQIMVIENHLRRRESGKALLRLQALEQTAGNPKLLYWQAYCQAREQEYPAALQTLKAIAALPQQAPWTAAAKRFAAALQTREKGIHAHAKLLRSLTRAAQDEFEVFEGTLVFADDHGKVSWQAYLGFDFPKGMTEVRVYAGPKRESVFYFSSKDNAQSIWMEGDPVIRRTSEGFALFPVPRIKITRLPDRSFSLSMNMDFGSKPEDLLKSKEELLQSKYLSTDAGTLEMLLQASKAKVPLPPEELADGKIRYAWLRPNPRTGAFTTLEFILDKDGNLLSVGTDRTRLQAMKYGKSGTVVLQPPPAPKLPAKTTAGGGEAEFMMLFSKVFQLIGRMGR